MRKIFLFFCLFCYGALAADAFSDPQEFVVFVGNPGVGKSTLINSIVEANVAASGLSAGLGLTTAMQSYEHKATTYIDTPGLADVGTKNQAAKEIEKAFTKPGQYRVFFIIVMQAGRVRPEDVTTINQVMDAIIAPDKAFSVIFNQVKAKERRMIFDVRANFNLIKAYINKGKNKASGFYVIDHDQNLDNDISDFINISPELDYFLHVSSKAFSSEWYGIKAIETCDVKELRRQLEFEKAEALKKINEQNQKADQMARQIAQAQAEAAAREQARQQEQERQRKHEEWIIRLRRSEQYQKASDAQMRQFFNQNRR